MSDRARLSEIENCALRDNHLYGLTVGKHMSDKLLISYCTIRAENFSSFDPIIAARWALI
jgi:hypothetical protein